jgi:hypothetical protein
VTMPPVAIAMRPPAGIHEHPHPYVVDGRCVGATLTAFLRAFYLSARVHKLTPNASTVLFLFYAALNGVTLSVVTLVLRR